VLTIIKRIKIAGFVILVCGLFYYQIIRGEYFSRKASSNYIRLIPKEAPRGLIFDRKGRLIVKNNLEFEVCLFSQKENEKVFENIAQILSTSPQVLKNNFRDNFVAPFTATVIYSTLNRNKILALQEQNIPQVTVRVRAKREAVSPYCFSHILGNTAKPSKEDIFLKKYGYIPQEEVGRSGIELSYDNYLRGKPGGLQVEIDSRGNLINFLGEKLPSPGKDIYTTLDVEIQTLAYEALKNHRGSLILMESESGKILSLVSRPSFNVNLFTEDKDYFREVNADKSKPLLNRPIQGKYPPGSVFKVVVALGALEEGKITRNKSFLCEEFFQLKAARFKCWSRHGWQDIVGGLLHSCNVFFYNTALLLGPEQICHYATLLGLGKKTDIDLPFENDGFLPTPKWKEKVLGDKWYPGDTLNLTIGQGYVLTTPIQIAKIMNFFATGDYLVQPYIVRKIDDLDIPIKKKEPLNMNTYNVELINEGLRGAVQNEEGTAHILKSLGMEIAGKTGTAQVSGRKSHAWFAGFFPYRRPRYTIVVMLENCGSSFEACRVVRSFLKSVKEKGILSDF